ncbi:carboxylesterase/lipase family protein [Leifsonia shinshuensis]|uniref:carboxylesterase/lipase family protein n=1 Tax=Leifsonia shinshuensis TaxID=150026 RepID=UPI002857E3BB|nr:carboxylesterase/lipase family protein [Leifsonia shinshuensis]MDR6971314.1 para-nitrobenzyl esterase [Leifsonia shinshuensis]
MSERPVVVTSAGAVRGRDDDRVSTWRGIRYAEPPTGRMRWRAPVPARPWDGVADAVRFGPAAPQRPNPSVPLAPGEPGGARLDEDCLFLNVVRPSADPPPGRPRPVMVWLHGGAYALGSSSQLVYHGDELVTSGDVVVVTLNYRLGALGFLDLGAAGVPGAESNVALRDVLLALRWVRDNIAAFGGDPARVTVFGQSAGAGLVTALLASPLAHGLFHRAIAQSPPAGSMYGPERSEVVARAFLERLGVRPDDAVALQHVPVERIVDAGAAVYADIPREHPGMLAFAPVVGDDVLPEAPLRILSEGRGMRVPLVIGTNRDEATLFRLMRSPLLPIRRAALQRMFQAMQEEQRAGGPDGARLPPPDRVLAAYRRAPLSRNVRIATDIAFRMPAVWAAAGHAEVAPTFLYRFDFAPPLLRLSGIGAAHATDLPYVWGEFGGLPRDPSFWLGGRRSADEVSRRMRARWASFAHGGAPGEGWPPYDAEQRATLLIDSEERVVPDLDGALRAGWGEQILSFR